MALLSERMDGQISYNETRKKCPLAYSNKAINRPNSAPQMAAFLAFCRIASGWRANAPAIVITAPTIRPTNAAFPNAVSTCLAQNELTKR